MGDLKNLSEIIERRLIPDYQRGFAWCEHQLNDYWEDQLQLAEDIIHYSGVITLKPVVESILCLSFIDASEHLVNEGMSV